jgi:hypothetical protein
MGSCLTCCKDDCESEWFFSTDSLPKDIDIECELDWSNLPSISPPNNYLSEKEIADLYRKEYLYQNRYKM